MKYSYNVEIFRHKNDTFYYLLGALITDGNIFTAVGCYKIQLTSKDADWIGILRKELNCPAYPTKDGHKNLTINSKEICRILLANGLTPNKSLTSEVPNIPDEYLADFVRGCMDGDGSIPNGINVQTYLYSSSIHFLTDMRNILTARNILSHIYEIKKSPYTLKNGKTIIPRHNYYRLTITDGAAKRFLSWVYYDGHKLSMPRKNKLAQQLLALT